LDAGNVGRRAVVPDEAFWDWCRAIRETSAALVEDARRLCERPDRPAWQRTVDGDGDRGTEPGHPDLRAER
jgi:hypothetical protein